MKTGFLTMFAGMAAFVMSGAVASAQINLAHNAPVVAFSGEYPNATYAVGNVTDGQNASPDNNTGGITEPSQDGSFWLGRDGVAAEYFVIDLGSAQNIGSFQLFNTRNGPYNDRGTGNFQIHGSNDLADLNLPSSGGTQVASGTLTPQTYAGAFGEQGDTPLVPDTFASSNTGPFQYIRFDALSIGAAADKGYGPAGVGLNEIRVFAVVPEPASLGLIAIGAMALLARRRRA